MNDQPPKAWPDDLPTLSELRARHADATREKRAKEFVDSLSGTLPNGKHRQSRYNEYLDDLDMLRKTPGWTLSNSKAQDVMVILAQLVFDEKTSGAVKIRAVRMIRVLESAELKRRIEALDLGQPYTPEPGPPEPESEFPVFEYLTLLPASVLPDAGKIINMLYKAGFDGST